LLVTAPGEAGEEVPLLLPQAARDTDKAAMTARVVMVRFMMGSFPAWLSFESELPRQ
jgi:hypothetical protein